MQYLLGLMFGLLWAYSAYAGTLTALIDKTIGSIDDQFVYTVTVTGSHSGQPELPKIKNLEIVQAGTSSSFSIINGNASRSTEYQYMIQALKEGSYQIPSISLKVDGEIQKTAPIRFRVEPPGKSSGDQPPVAFVKRELSSEQAYQGEPIIGKIKIYFRQQLADVQNVSDANANFTVYKSEDQRTYTEEVDGIVYQVHEFTEVLVPNKVGKLTVNPFVLETKILDDSPSRRRRRPGPGSLFEDFFGGDFGRRYKRKVLRADEQTVEVVAVPKKGRPKNFSGLVGSFEIAASLSADEVKTGETVTLTVTVSGSGLIDQLKDIDLNLPEEMKIYADKPLTEQLIDGDTGFHSKKVFKYAVVPTAPGDYALSPIALHVFVPKLGSFVELSAQLPALSVTGEPESIGQAGGGLDKRRVEKLADDIISIHRGTALTERHNLHASDWWFLSALAGLPTFGLFVTWLWRRRRDSYDPLLEQRKRRSKAYRLLVTELSCVQAGSELLLILRRFLGGLLGVKGETLTEKDAAAKLQTHGVGQDTIRQLMDLWQQLVKSEYGTAPLTETQSVVLKESLQDIAKKVDQQC